VKQILSIFILSIWLFLLPVSIIARPFQISMFFWHESPNDQMAFEGIKSGFKIAGIDCQYDIQRADGDEKKALRIVERLDLKNPDLIYAMGTGATKRLMRKVFDTPIVFTAVTNPVLTKITPNWRSSGRNITGNSNWIPTRLVLESFKEIIPNLKTLGVICDPVNPVSTMELSNVEKLGEKFGITLMKVQVKTAEELPAATRKLVNNQVDAIWIPIDILVYKNLEKIKSVTIPSGIPLISSSHRGVTEGAIYGIVVDYHALGKRSVPLALEILVNKTHPRDIPIGTMNSFQDIVNLKAAKEIGYQIPLEVLAVTDRVIK